MVGNTECRQNHMRWSGEDSLVCKVGCEDVAAVDGGGVVSMPEKDRCGQR